MHIYTYNIHGHTHIKTWGVELHPLKMVNFMLSVLCVFKSKGKKIENGNQTQAKGTLYLQIHLGRD